MARDERFAGVFEYLARDLPQDAADELKEYLLSAALDRSYHRLSDRFLQHLRCLAPRGVNLYVKIEAISRSTPSAQLAS